MINYDLPRGPNWISVIWLVVVLLGVPLGGVNIGTALDVLREKFANGKSMRVAAAFNFAIQIMTGLLLVVSLVLALLFLRLSLQMGVHLQFANHFSAGLVLGIFILLISGPTVYAGVTTLWRVFTRWAFAGERNS